MPDFRDDITPAFEEIHDFHEHVFDELCPENSMEDPVGSKDLLLPMVRLVSTVCSPVQKSVELCQKSACLYSSLLLASFSIIVLTYGLEIARESNDPGEC